MSFRPRGASTCIDRSISSKKSDVTTASSTCRRRSPASSRRRLRQIRASRAIAACGRPCSAWDSPRRSRLHSSKRRRPNRISTADRRWRSPIRCPRSSPSCVRACCRDSSTCSATIGATGGLTSVSSRSARASRLKGKPAARRSHGWDSVRPITGAATGGRLISPTSRVSWSNSRRSRRFPSPSRKSSARSSCADARRTS